VSAKSAMTSSSSPLVQMSHRADFQGEVVILPYVELSEASTAGKTFALTGGEHMTSTDIQIALELKKQKKDFEALAAKKAKATRGSKESELDAKILAELDQKGKQYLTEEGSASLTCPQLDALLRVVLGKTVKGNKSAKLAWWLEVRGQEFLPSARSSLWTDEDEARLIEAQGEVVGIKDTFVGRKLEKKKMEAGATLTRASPGTKRDLAKTWYEIRSPGGMQRLTELCSSLRDKLEGVERDREREEETSTDVDSV
jgi:hypothetical protein